VGGLPANDAAVNISKNEGRTPLHLAVRRPHPEATILLLSAGADPNYQDHERNAPLPLAVKSENQKIVEDLLIYDARFETEENNRRTPLDIAEEDECTEIALNSIKRGVDGRQPMERSSSIWPTLTYPHTRQQRNG
jgi:ankyrin repeat protein